MGWWFAFVPLGNGILQQEKGFVFCVWNGYRPYISKTKQTNKKPKQNKTKTKKKKTSAMNNHCYDLH